MARKDRTLVLDIGATAVHMGEFEIPAGGGLILQAFANVEYSEPLTEGNRSLVISSAIRKALEDGNFTKMRHASVCVSGQAAFMRFVKLPPVTEEESRVRQIVEYEARQNVPFPMEEVIWDYQLIGGDQDEDLEVMFAVIKNEIVESVIQAVTDVGLEVTLVDFAPASLYNAARANYIGEEECAMLLDIGGRCSNLLFLDGPRFFARAIPIAGFSVTQQVAKEFSITPEEAEILKRRHGFVALGGAYEEPESEVAATISKIVRNVMTRLHGEINRSINVYRTQQKGNKPTHLYLSGGSAIMEFTTHFFSEKLRMEASYFNPMKIVTEGPGINTQELEEIAHALPEVVGTGLRDAVECPVEISLVTDSIRKQQGFARKKPFLVACCLVWLMILAIFYVVNAKKRTLFETTYVNKSEEIGEYNTFRGAIEEALDSYDTHLESYKDLQAVLDRRYEWSDVLNAVQLAKPRDVWLTSVVPTTPSAADAESSSSGRGGGRSPFGGSVFRMRRPTDSGGGDESEVSWLEISGYCVEIPEKAPPGAGADGETLIRQIFLDEQIENFKQTLPEGDKPFWGDNLVTDEPRVTQVFVASLRHSSLFIDDKDHTRLAQYSESVARNLTAFTILAKLSQVIAKPHE